MPCLAELIHTEDTLREIARRVKAFKIAGERGGVAGNINNPLQACAAKRLDQRRLAPGAGRIKHHLKHNLWRKECTILFVGYQAVSTLGRSLLEGATNVKLFGESIEVQAEICQLTGLSGHADREGLLKWVNSFEPKPKRVFVIHGEDEVENIFTQTLTEQGFTACAPYNGEQWAIGAEGAVCLKEGTRTRIEHRVSEGAARAATVFQRLLSAGKRLLRVIEHNEGGANKDLAKFADQINALCDKWDR